MLTPFVPLLASFYRRSKFKEVTGLGGEKATCHHPCSLVFTKISQFTKISSLENLLSDLSAPQPSSCPEKLSFWKILPTKWHRQINSFTVFWVIKNKELQIDFVIHMMWFRWRWALGEEMDTLHKALGNSENGLQVGTNLPGALKVWGALGAKKAIDTELPLFDLLPCNLKSNSGGWKRVPVFQSEHIELMPSGFLLSSHRLNMKGKRKKMESEPELINNTFWTCCFQLLRSISIIIWRTWWTSQNNLWYVYAHIDPLNRFKQASLTRLYWREACCELVSSPAPMLVLGLVPAWKSCLLAVFFLPSFPPLFFLPLSSFLFLF